jgi:hypothetical protein
MNLISELLKLSVKDLFGLAVLGALVTAVGNLIAIALKDYIFARSLEKWKARQQLRSVYIKYRDPLLLSIFELLRRLAEIIYESPVDFLSAELLTSNPPVMVVNSAEDEYYQRYKLLSTIYRLCACMGWLELYRRDITFLDSGHNRTNAKFQSLVEKLRSSLADGQLNRARDWHKWKDSLIFREEQRAIGEVMIDGGGDRVIGYSDFCERFDAAENSSVKRWLNVAAGFLLDLRSAERSQKDFRQARCLLLIDHGISLIECLDSRRVNEYLLELRMKIQTDLKKHPVDDPELHSRAATVGKS